MDDYLLAALMYIFPMKAGLQMDKETRVEKIRELFNLTHL